MCNDFDSLRAGCSGHRRVVRTLKSWFSAPPSPDPRAMTGEIPFERSSDPLQPVATVLSPLARLGPRIRRAADSARRAGPEGATMLRRSIAVYADDASSSQVPKDRFLATVHRELMEVLTSRVSMRRIGLLLDAAAQGTLEGYGLHERIAAAHGFAAIADGILRDT